MNRETLVNILGTKFGDDPVALEAIHRAIRTDYSGRLKEALGALRKEMEEAHAIKLEKVHTTFETRLASVVETLMGSFNKELKAEASRIRKEVMDDAEKQYGKTHERITSLEENADRRNNSVMKSIERHDRKIERFSQYAIGAPNRSLYVNGALISPYFSDVNIVPGTGITLTPSTDQTKQQAKLTISSTGGGAGINPQIPVGTINSNNRVFTCTGLVQVAMADNGVDVGAVITGATNSTITYSVPPQNNAFAF